MANIDDELVFIRDAGEYDGNISREAIANALDIINKDIYYTNSETLVVTENDDYYAPEGTQYNKVVVNVPGGVPFGFDGYAERITFKKNGTYQTKEMFDKNLVITEFDVEVPEWSRDPVVKEITESGVYESLSDEYYSRVVVDIPNTPHQGDYVSAIFYFLDPSNPNDAAKTVIFQDNHILFGTDAASFLRRFPKLKQVRSGSMFYTHLDWNSDPSVITCNKDYIPSWALEPDNRDLTGDPRYFKLDSDIVLYIAQHKLVDLYFNPGDVIALHNPQSGLRTGSIKYEGNALEYVSDAQSNYLFSVTTGIDLPYCDDSLDISTENTINGTYYWYGCSLVRALLNKDKSILITQEDRDKYDILDYDISDYISDDIELAIIPTSHYIMRAVPRDSSYRYYQKSVPRDSLSYYAQDSYYDFPLEDIPVDPNTGQQSPKYAELYERTRSGRDPDYTYTFTLTQDVRIRKDHYYGKRDGYKIRVSKPTLSDEFDETYQKTCYSDFDLRLKHSSVLYLKTDGARLLPYKNINGVETQITDDEIKAFIDLRPLKPYYKYTYNSMDSLRLTIANNEGISDATTIDIDMSKIYFYKTEPSPYTYSYVHWYLYDNVYPKIYYSFNLSESGSISSIARYSEIDSPSTIQSVDNNIIRNNFKRSVFFWGSLNGIDMDAHGYVKEGDIWPDESLIEYASGGFFENYNNIPIGDYGYIYYSGLHNISDFYFFNYYEVKNGMSTCPDSYHFVEYYDETAGKIRYRVTKKASTDYSGFQSTNIHTYVDHVTEKITEKFFILQSGSGTHGVKESYTFDSYAMTAPFDYINSQLVSDIYNVEQVANGNRANMPLLEYDESYNKIYYNHSVINGYSTNISPYTPKNRNMNRYIYADQKTVEWFNEKAEEYEEDPGINTMPTEEDTHDIWQYYYDHFSEFQDDQYYELYSPHNWDYQDGGPRKFSKAYFFL